MSSSHESALESLLSDIHSEYPHFRIVSKRGDTLSIAIDRAIRIVTLGTQSEYMSRYHTVLGYSLYVPTAWDSTSAIDKIITLRHERVHLRQRRRLGLIWMAFLYLVPFFPFGLAYGRARLEWEAYAESLRASAELKGIESVRSSRMRHYVLDQFTSGAYGWMWPFRRHVESWYDAVLQELECRYTCSDA